RGRAAELRRRHPAGGPGGAAALPERPAAGPDLAAIGLPPGQHDRPASGHGALAAAQERLPQPPPAAATRQPPAGRPRDRPRPARRSAVNRQADQRLRLIVVLFAAAFTLVFGRALWIQIVQADALAAKAHGQQNATITVPTNRGRILDRSGHVLAVDV